MVAVAIVAAAVLAACGGSGGADATDAAAEDAPSEAVTEDVAEALLGIIEPGVDVADEPADLAGAEYRTGEDGEGLVVGDLVRTDPSGFAEVEWFDGALARVDIDTVYALTALDATPGTALVETDLQVGRIWNRLRADGVESYEVTTDVGTAAVRGTAFWVACDGACTFAVLEGTVQVTAGDGTEVTLEAGQQVTVDVDGVADEVGPTDFEDPWVVRNAALDEDAGFAALEQPEPAIACPLVDVPAGWELVEPEDPDAPEAQFCQYSDPDATPPSWAGVRWRQTDDEEFRTSIERNRPFYEETVEEIQSSDCGEGMRDLYRSWDEPLGAGHIYGFSWYVARGPLPATFGECLNDRSANSFSVVVDGEVFLLLGAEGISACQPPQVDETEAEWNSYLDCQEEVWNGRIDAYMEIAATLLGG